MSIISCSVRTAPAVLLLLLAGLGAGCVSSGAHEAQVVALEKARGELNEARRTAVARQAELDKLREHGRTMEKEGHVLEVKLGEARHKLEALEAPVKRDADVEARLGKALQAPIAEGKVLLVRFQGRMLLRLPERALFAGPAARAVRKEALPLLRTVALALQSTGRSYRVAGHSNEHAAKPGLAAPRELSLARAQAVTRLLEQSGVDPWQVFPAGLSGYSPLDGGHTKEALETNRRLEIILLPFTRPAPRTEEKVFDRAAAPPAGAAPLRVKGIGKPRPGGGGN